MTLTIQESGTYPEFGTRNQILKKFKNAEVFKFEDHESMTVFLKEHRDFQVYTELHHSENFSRYYLDRGFHFCNRTGRYVCIKDPRFTVMQYKGLD